MSCVQGVTYKNYNFKANVSNILLQISFSKCPHTFLTHSMLFFVLLCCSCWHLVCFMCFLAGFSPVFWFFLLGAFVLFRVFLLLKASYTNLAEGHSHHAPSICGCRSQPLRIDELNNKWVVVCPKYHTQLDSSAPRSMVVMDGSCRQWS